MTANNFNFQLKTIVHAQRERDRKYSIFIHSIRRKTCRTFSDKGLESLGFVEQFSALFVNQEAGQDAAQLVGVYTDIAPDATCDNINSAIEFANNLNADAILSAGGGSVIDASKGVVTHFINRLMISALWLPAVALWKCGQITKTFECLTLQYQQQQARAQKLLRLLFLASMKTLRQV